MGNNIKELSDHLLLDKEIQKKTGDTDNVHIVYFFESTRTTLKRK